MRKITLTIKDDKKTDFLMELLEEFDFIEIRQSGHNLDLDLELEGEEKYDFFSSAGMWKERDIDADKLRKQAWKRTH